jgi:hypothetical protein
LSHIIPVQIAHPASSGSPSHNPATPWNRLILKQVVDRRSYARRTGAERGFATAKDPATNDISRDWCRLMGLAPLMLAVTCLLIVRNQRILTAWNARQEQNTRRPCLLHPHGRSPGRG